MDTDNNIFDTNKSNSRNLLVLGITSIMLVVSFALSPLTPFPIALGILLFGKFRGISLGVICSVVVFLGFKLLSKDFGNSPGPLFLMFYIFSVFVAISVSYMISKNMNPVDGLIKVGGALAAMVSIVGGVLFYVFSGEIQKIVPAFSKHLANEYLRVEDKLDLSTIEQQQQFNLFTQPELVTELIFARIPLIPGWTFVAVFFVIWITLFLVLKSNRLYHFSTNYEYDETDLIKFKMPEFFIWLVISLLAVVFLGEEKIGADFFILAINLLRCLSIFYFFQGIGIFLDFLTFAGFTGFMRIAFIVMSVMFFSLGIVFIGLFDMWVNFRKYFVKKNSEK